MSIHAIWGPPRSGKTTIAIDLAYAISQSRKTVCLLSTERYSELSARMCLHIGKEKSLAAIKTGKESLRQVVFPADDLLYVLAAPHDNDAFESELTAEQAKLVIEQLDSIFDMVIVDCSSYCDSSLAAWAMKNAASVIMLSGGSVTASMWYSAYGRAVETVEQKLIPVCAEVCSGFDYKTLHKLIGFKPEVWLPHYPEAEAEQCELHTLYDSGGRLGHKYTAAIDDICDIIEDGGD